MFLRHKIRRKDGKEHRSWSVVENRRVAGGRVVQRQVVYLGRSTTVSARHGPGRSRRLMTTGDRGRLRRFPRIVQRRFSIAMWFRFA
jgi:hypothetical protein